eukprot:TRINITY_DN13571_c0_g1_i2.p1 TRINITY_DN13571_c0_g1~~TRINITY_DN13571_c0_g1_i2.p1  ORF type:complete len:213 (-),score=20.36 TRINITY_DN13571_c0_g1_i2:431-1069(-)
MCIRDSSWRHNVMSTHDMRRGVMPPDEEGNPLTRPEMEEADLSPEPRAPTSELPPIDVKLARYPCCIVWTPLPLITFLCPVIGHIGICDAAGHIYDFGGGVHVDQFMFGDVARYIQLDPAMCKNSGWDAGVRKGNEDYAHRCHNLCCDNCHSHVATCLDHMAFRGFRRWNMVILAFWVFFAGRFTSTGMALYTLLPFSLLVLLWAALSGHIL